MLGAILRRTRGVLGTALTWAVGWTGVGALLSFVVPGWPLMAAVTVGFLGLYTGATFAVMLSITQRRRTLDQLSLPKMAAIGATVAGVVLAYMLGSGTPAGIWWSYMAVGAVLGAGSAAGHVAVAKRAAQAELAGEVGAPQIESH